MPIYFQKEIQLLLSIWMIAFSLPFNLFEAQHSISEPGPSCLHLLSPLPACQWSLQIFSSEANGNVSKALTYISDSWRGTQTVQFKMTGSSVTIWENPDYWKWTALSILFFSSASFKITCLIQEVEPYTCLVKIFDTKHGVNDNHKWVS